MAKLLKRGGGIGLFWNRADERNTPYRRGFTKPMLAMRPLLMSSEIDVPLNDWIDFKKGGIESSGLFAPVSIRQYPWSLSYDAEAYLELSGTYSDHLSLGEEQRSALFNALRREIEMLGGSIVKKYVAVLFFAKRA